MSDVHNKVHSPTIGPQRKKSHTVKAAQDVLDYKCQFRCELCHGAASAGSIVERLID